MRPPKEEKWSFSHQVISNRTRYEITSVLRAAGHSISVAFKDVGAAHLHSEAIDMQQYGNEEFTDGCDGFLPS